MENLEHNPVAKQAIAALEARPELLPSFVEEIEDYLLGKLILEGETGEYMSREEFKKIVEE